MSSKTNFPSSCGEQKIPSPNWSWGRSKERKGCAKVRLDLANMFQPEFPLLPWIKDCLSNILSLWEVEVCAEGDEERAALWKWLSLPHSLAQAQLLPHFQTERRAERGDFYFPGDRDIINYLPFCAASCQWIGQRSTDRISPYPLTHWWAHHSTAVHLAWAVLIILITLLHRVCLY